MNNNNIINNMKSKTERRYFMGQKIPSSQEQLNTFSYSF